MTEHLSRLNFRDLGGLPAQGGRHVRFGVLYRSEGPASFAAEHREELAALDFKLVCDLRSAAERNAAPNDWSPTARLFNLDITNDLRSDTNEGWAALRHDPSEEAARTAMMMNYRAIPGALMRYLPALVGALTDGEVPALVHCTAGKDRTGVLVAVLLKLLGVRHEAILADYLRSDVFGKNLRFGGSIGDAFRHMFGFVPSDSTISAIIGVYPAFLDAALDAIDAKWGSIGAYAQAAGMGAAQLARFRNAILVDDVHEGPAASSMTA
jgi:protein-tyrosine phosphatase